MFNWLDPMLWAVLAGIAAVLTFCALWVVYIIRHSPIREDYPD